MTLPVQPEAAPARWRIWLDRLAALGMLAPAGLGAAALTGMDNRWVDILAQFTGPAMTASLLALAGALVLRLRLALFVGLAAAATLAAAVWPQWAPAGPRAQPGAPIVRLYSANVYYRNDDVAALRRSIAEADADIVILIELGSDALGRIDALLDGYPHRTASMRMDQTRGPSRTVVASRWPVEPGVDRPDGLHAVASVVRTPIGPINVVGAHLTRPWPFQNSWGQISQTLALDRLTRDLDGPLIVAGDFNSVSSARIGRQVKADLGLHPAPGFPGTWPASLPASFGVTIDQVYASDDLAFVARRLGRANGSDHRPVITEFTRARPPAP